MYGRSSNRRRFGGRSRTRLQTPWQGRVTRQGAKTLRVLARAGYRPAPYPRTQLMQLYKQPSPFPLSMLIKQAYSEVLNLTVGTAGLFGTEKVFSLNDMYDPDYTATGHQPYGRDTMATIYNRYKVYGCKVEIVFYGADTNSIATSVMLSNPSNFTSPLQGKTVNQVLECNQAQVKYLSSNGNQKQTFNTYVSMAKLFNISKLQYKADTAVYQATSAGSSPPILGVLRVAIADTDLGSTATCNCSVKLTYLCRWWDRKLLAQS